MLPAAHRLRASADFAAVTRSGMRTRSGDLVVYLLPSPDRCTAMRAADRSADRTGPSTCCPSRAGLIVGKRVGGSVIRHQVSRRLRAQLATRLAALPSGADLVVRALPPASTASSEQLGRDLDHALGTLTRRIGRRS